MATATKFFGNSNTKVGAGFIGQYDTTGDLPTASGLIEGTTAWVVADTTFYKVISGAWVEAGQAGSIKQVSSLAALKSLAAGKWDQVFLNASGRRGIFYWDSTDNSTNVTNDPGEDVYIPPDSDTTGASGVWIRVPDPSYNLFSGKSVFGPPKWAWVSDSYEAWPNGVVWYDNGKFHICYTDGDSHRGDTKQVYYRNRTKDAPSDPWSAATLVAPQQTVGGFTSGATVHAAGEMPNGNYWCVVRYASGTSTSETIRGTYSFRSTDNGATWTDEGQIQVGGTNANPTEFSNFFITKTGRVLMYGRGDSNFNSGAAFVAYSDDNGTTWSSANVPSGSYPNNLEGCFVQVNDGTIISYVRAGGSSPPYSTTTPMVYTVSTDDGGTWSTLAASSTITAGSYANMTENNAMAIHWPEVDEVEIVYASRNPRTDGYGSVWHTRAPAVDAKTATFPRATRIALGPPTKDFGYPAIVKSDEGDVVLVMYYAGYDINPGTTSTNEYPRITSSGLTYMFEMFSKRNSWTGAVAESQTENVDSLAGLVKARSLPDLFTGEPHITYGTEYDQMNVTGISRLAHYGDPASGVAFRFGPLYRYATKTLLLDTTSASIYVFGANLEAIDMNTKMPAANKPTPVGVLAGYELEYIFEFQTVDSRTLYFDSQAPLDSDRAVGVFVEASDATGVTRVSGRLQVQCSGSTQNIFYGVNNATGVTRFRLWATGYYPVN